MKATVEIADSKFTSTEQLEKRRSQLSGKFVRTKYEKRIVGRISSTWIQNGILYVEINFDGLEIEG